MTRNIDLDNTNPLEDLYEDFERIVKQAIIKFQVKAEMYETMETKMWADQYIAAKNKTDTFYSYTDYDEDDVREAGLMHSLHLIELVREGRYTEIPQMYHQPLLEVRRKNILDTFEEQNEYYRCLNGLPPLDREAKFWYYVPTSIAKRYKIDIDIPIHK